VIIIYLGAFSAAPKTGLCGAPRSRAPAPATPWLNPFNPLRDYGARRAATADPKRGVLRSKTPETIAALRQAPMTGPLAIDFELVLFGEKHYTLISLIMIRKIRGRPRNLRAIVKTSPASRKAQDCRLSARIFGYESMRSAAWKNAVETLRGSPANP
jgi:hypothetical protein